MEPRSPAASNGMQGLLTALGLVHSLLGSGDIMQNALSDRFATRCTGFVASLSAHGS